MPDLPFSGKLVKREREYQLRPFMEDECLSSYGSYYGEAGVERFLEDFRVEAPPAEGEWSVLIWDAPPEENEFGLVSP